MSPLINTVSPLSSAVPGANSRLDPPPITDIVAVPPIVLSLAKFV